jgi:predicted membrane protein
MEKLSNFLNKNGFLVVVIILLLMFVNQCSTKNATQRVAKYQKEMTINNQRQDSIMSVRMEDVEKKLDSTLISNGAVIDANRQTSAAINNKKQNIVIKMDKQ